MSGSNGVIRIGRKGIKKFAFGDDGAPFEVDVVVAFQEWIRTDEEFRPVDADEDGNRPIATADMPTYHRAAVQFVENLCAPVNTKSHDTLQPSITTAEALDFIARLREQYDALAVFFRPKSRDEPDSQDTSEVELHFSEEAP